MWTLEHMKVNFVQSWLSKVCHLTEEMDDIHVNCYYHKRNGTLYAEMLSHGHIFLLS